ncbi:Solute carrier family 35 member F3/F4 like protein [Aduncisulcus paluster]|uniref:Solute carrier family 35 member F3/F4 like protein n=1 Tax=Aduncisulcus paluster TaxID=2918883 RepID=A0ABQ5KW15_9EUKA|nr:Solute carrier family 35 member F3/F4 like protein [Aduncisulcus paluster]|eukprot:gnl/Carplike_NY0171/2692_a3614_355.p1 GENE.gnl/Carplike_NY0171/2692_a3614_355~~gnl/Carplike_NY0171/2692_a3614_355.p1  ORF type:complete len:501 (-),score=112.53 gnl/Carplike_NY0171/2692_a3614_355:455-1957(-)
MISRKEKLILLAATAFTFLSAFFYSAEGEIMDGEVLESFPRPFLISYVTHGLCALCIFMEPIRWSVQTISYKSKSKKLQNMSDLEDLSASKTSSISSSAIDEKIGETLPLIEQDRDDSSSETITEWDGEAETSDKDKKDPPHETRLLPDSPKDENALQKPKPMLFTTNGSFTNGKTIGKFIFLTYLYIIGCWVWVIGLAYVASSVVTAIANIGAVLVLIWNRIVPSKPNPGKREIRGSIIMIFAAVIFIFTLPQPDEAHHSIGDVVLGVFLGILSLVLITAFRLFYELWWPDLTVYEQMHWLGEYGVYTLVFCLPIIPLLSVTGVEKWTAPTLQEWLVLCSTGVSEFLMNLTMFLAFTLSSPLFFCAGNGVTVTISLILDLSMHRFTISWWRALIAFICTAGILVGTIDIGFGEKERETQRKQEEEGESDSIIDETIHTDFTDGANPTTRDSCTDKYPRNSSLARFSQLEGIAGSNISLSNLSGAQLIGNDDVVEEEEGK